MSPRNMLVVPAEWAGLAEVPEFLAGFQSAELGRVSGRNDR